MNSTNNDTNNTGSRNYRYPFTNAIVFSLVMKDSELCKGLLQRIFPDREIREVRQHETFPHVERTVIVDIEARKVRLDVLFRDDTAWYDIEMQVRDEMDIPKRIRYTHGILDVDALKPGDDYNDLKPSYVIFLCCFDLFGKGVPVYSFTTFDEKNHLSLGDETYTIILNSTADEEVTPESLRGLFKYMNGKVVSEEDELVRRIDHSVGTWNSGEGVTMVMTLEQEIMIRETRARKDERNKERQRFEQKDRNRIRRMSANGISADSIAYFLGYDRSYVDQVLGDN